MEYEEDREISPVWSWVIVVLFSLALAGWGFFTYSLVGTHERTWDFGTLPDVPGQSVYSIGPVPASPTPPQQIVPLPEATPWITPTPSRERPERGR